MYHLAILLCLLLLAPMAQAHGGHSGDEHPPFEVSADLAPRITDVVIAAVGESKLRITIATANFRFAAPHERDEAGGGHAEIYINGVKLAHSYSAVFDSDELPKGEHDFRIVLTTADHSEYSVQGRPVEVRISFDVQ